MKHGDFPLRHVGHYQKPGAGGARLAKLVELLRKEALVRQDMRVSKMSA